MFLLGHFLWNLQMMLQILHKPWLLPPLLAGKQYFSISTSCNLYWHYLHNCQSIFKIKFLTTKLLEECCCWCVDNLPFLFFRNKLFVTDMIEKKTTCKYWTVHTFFFISSCSFLDNPFFVFIVPMLNAFSLFCAMPWNSQKIKMCDKLWRSFTQSKV